MFEIGDFVIKPNNGICRVDDIGHPDISSVNKERLYFFLTPLNEVNTKLYVPTDRTDNGLRRVITEDEAWKFIDDIPKISEAWISDDKQREQRYKEAIQSCDLEKLMGIIKSMYARMQKRTAQGKKNTSVDEHFFKIAENNLYTELAFAIGRNKEEMQTIIAEKIEQNK
ncbi:MAG: CarD family transcriptional regulator [Lachnospiraceae bacterium]|nr:CarD family transcriptional regulator [Lachnospiraceae bacterium]